MLYVTLTNAEIVRIFNRITIDKSKNCWNWEGAKQGAGRGYGLINYRGTVISLHRLIYAWLIGPIPLGKGNGIPVIEHSCDNPRCCNPEHLELGPQRHNVLKGNSTAAVNHRKTHCIRGHLLPLEPNENHGQGTFSRRCIICRRINAHNRYQRKHLDHA